MKRIYTLLLLLLSLPAFALAQDYRGKVFFLSQTSGKEPAAFANVWWLEGKTAVETDEDGAFILRSLKGNDVTLVAAFLGYSKDTVQVVTDGVDHFPDRYLEFNLIPENELNSVTVTGRQAGNFLSRTKAMKTEVISQAGLCKMACCALAESFEGSATVTVGYSDAVTGAKQIKLLGLSGSYTQMLDETRPVMRGLATPFGLNYIPGQWLESIQIAKGPSSVVNGLEAISGQINVEHRKPTAENPLFLNLFFNSHLKPEANVASSIQFNEKWSTVILGHFSKDTKKHDMDKDGFRDSPLTQQFSFDNRWLYFNPNGVQVRFGAKYMQDERIGGQWDYEKGMNERGATGMEYGEAYGDPMAADDASRIWGNEIFNRGAGGFLKVGVPLKEDQSRSVAVVADYSYYDMQSSYGLKDYDGYQNIGWFNAMYLDNANEKHHYILGVSGRYDDINSRFDDHMFAARKRPDNAPGVRSMEFNCHDRSIGVYGEYTFNWKDRLSIIAGVRADYSSLNRWQFAPRINAKYSFTENTVLRLNAGRGFRNPNPVTDNLGILSSSRALNVDPDRLQAEEAWTYGGNFTQYFKVGGRENNYISFDYFRSSFNRKIVYDWDSGYDANGAGTVDIYDFNEAGPGRNRAFTDTYQVDFSIEPVKRFTVIATFRYSNAKISMKGRGLVEAPMTSRYKAVLNLQYATGMNRWTFDATAQLNGPCTMPAFMGDGVNLYRTPVYPMLFAQVTRKFKMVEVYAGLENISNYTQSADRKNGTDPILHAQAPYSDKFNASMVWGPLNGRMYYIGMRLTLWKK